MHKLREYLNGPYSVLKFEEDGKTWTKVENTKLCMKWHRCHACMLNDLCSNYKHKPKPGWLDRRAPRAGGRKPACPSGRVCVHSFDV